MSVAKKEPRKLFDETREMLRFVVFSDDAQVRVGSELFVETTVTVQKRELENLPGRDVALWSELVKFSRRLTDPARTDADLVQIAIESVGTKRTIVNNLFELFPV